MTLPQAPGCGPRRPSLPRRSGPAPALLFVLLLLLAAPPVRAKVAVAEATLDNGLKVLVHRNPQAPIIACRIFYVTGSVHEGPGRSGIAHLLEHMLFKGTKKVGTRDLAQDARLMQQIDEVWAAMRRAGSDTARAALLRARYDTLLAAQRRIMIKDELWETYLREGGSGLNAFTTDLMTAYFVTLPKNRLELYLWLEADRMQNAVLREFYAERDVVLEERRMRVEDRPTGRYWESLSSLFYEAHPFRLPTIGYYSDLKHLSREQAEEHYRKYYKPNNAILVLTGDVDPEAAIAQVKRYFGPIPRGQEFPPVVTAEPEQVGEKRLSARKNDAEPRVDMLFHTPGFPHEDLFALDILEGVLSGKSGRLYRRLVREKKTALGTSAGNGLEKYASSFYIGADIPAGMDPQKVEKGIWEVLRELAEKPISARELERVKNNVLAARMRKLTDMENLATELAYWEARGGWRHLDDFPENVMKVTPAQVQAVAARYFKPHLATVGTIVAEGSAK